MVRLGSNLQRNASEPSWRYVFQDKECKRLEAGFGRVGDIAEHDVDYHPAVLCLLVISQML